METRVCRITKIELPISMFPYKSKKHRRTSVLGTLWTNVSQRAANGVYHKNYAEHHIDSYTRKGSLVQMDPAWVNDPTKFGYDILTNIGAPMYRNGKKLSLDRIENDGGYFIENLRWATAMEQARNKGRGELKTWHGTGNARTF